MVTGCDEDEYSWETSDLQSGVFTYHFLQELYIYDKVEQAFTIGAPKAHNYLWNNYGEIMNPQMYDQYAGDWEF